MSHDIRTLLVMGIFAVLTGLTIVLFLRLPVATPGEKPIGCFLPVRVEVLSCTAKDSCIGCRPRTFSQNAGMQCVRFNPETCFIYPIDLSPR